MKNRFNRKERREHKELQEILPTTICIPSGRKHPGSKSHQGFSLRSLRSLRLNNPVKLFPPPGFR